MQFIRNALDNVAPHFEKGGKLNKFHALYEAPDTFLFTPGLVTKAGAHVRDGIDLKRMMITVAIALQPCFFMASWNTGYQANLAISNGATPLDDFNTAIFTMLGFTHDPESFLANPIYGMCYFVPIFLVTQVAGGTVEVATATIRKHEINEGFLVTGSLFPLILPPTIPLWQVAVGIIFGVLIGKEIFGGTGMNVLNPALVARAFLFFAYPAQISGDTVWIAADTTVDRRHRRHLARSGGPRRQRPGQHLLVRRLRRHRPGPWERPPRSPACSAQDCCSPRGWRPGRRWPASPRVRSSWR